MVDADKLRERHPDYEKLMQSNDKQAADITHPVASAWSRRLTEAGIEGRRNLIIDQVRETAVANKQVRQAVTANNIENFEPVFNKLLEDLFIERMDGNEAIFVRLMNDDAFRNIAAGYLMKAVYQQMRGGAEAA